MTAYSAFAFPVDEETEFVGSDETVLLTETGFLETEQKESETELRIHRRNDQN